jgi:hypothetical protein
MIEGKRDESLQLLAANYRLGQFMTGDTILIDRLIGIAVKAISTRGLAIYALNACESDTEFKQLWEMLDRLEQNEKPDEVRAMMWIERPYDQTIGPEFLRPNFEEALTRADVSHDRFELVRMATAAKHRLVSTGEFPKNDKEFAPFLPKELPKDPFADGPMRFLSTSDSLVCYSIGPDKTDNRAAIEYDPTNGTLSAGDISIKVPRQREFPFPRGGVRARDIQDFRRQFPNSLPADPFGSSRGPLATTTTAAGDIYVFSYGPNVDEHKPPQPHVLEVQYDPTNGTISEGDLLLRIPRP